MVGVFWCTFSRYENYCPHGNISQILNEEVSKYWWKRGISLALAGKIILDVLNNFHSVIFTEICFGHQALDASTPKHLIWKPKNISNSDSDSNEVQILMVLSSIPMESVSES